MVKKSPKRSGHGDLHKRALPASTLGKIRELGRAVITVSGQRKTVTPCNLKNGRIEWYKRSDTGNIALRNYCSDVHRSSTVRNRKRRGFEGDTRLIKSKGGRV